MATCQCAHVPGDLPPIVVAKSSVSDFRIMTSAGRWRSTKWAATGAHSGGRPRSPSSRTAQKPRRIGRRPFRRLAGVNAPAGFRCRFVAGWRQDRIRFAPASATALHLRRACGRSCHHIARGAEVILYEAKDFQIGAGKPTDSHGPLTLALPEPLPKAAPNSARAAPCC